MSQRYEKAGIGGDLVAEVWVGRQSEQDALASTLACLRWYAIEAGLSFTQATEHSRTIVMHDRVNGGSHD